ncbi:hypothetical protein IH992_03125 [Candidatus Poribacteria bacterium]|nr:hypothetical protein [Candidatus Poribacteria bacterium]
MPAYYREGENWEDYLQRKAFAEDVPTAIEQIKRKIDYQQVDREEQTDDLDFISEGIAGLQSAFDIAMEKVLWKLQMRRESLNKILVELRSPELEDEAKTFRQRAEEAYINGWYEEALDDFLEAEKQNSRDFSVLRSIANIYLYEKLNYDKALEYYEKCAKFAEPYSKAYTAEVLMLAGWVCYLQRDDSAAITNAQNALQMNPRLTEAYYTHAKFAAASGNAQIAILSLEKAILVDAHYWTKVENDRDFDSIQSDLQSLPDCLRDKAKAEAESILDAQKILDDYYIKPCMETQQLTAQLNEATNLFNQAATCFDYLELIPKLRKYRKTFDTLRNYGEIAILKGHANHIRSLSFSPDGAVLASASGKTIWLWDMTTKEQTAILEGHTRDVACITFSPNGRLLVSGSGDGTVRVWDVATKQAIAQLEGHTDWVTSVSFSPDGRLLASASEDSTIRLWDVATKQPIVQFGQHMDATLRLWKLWKTDTVLSIAFSPDGRFLVSASKDRIVRLWQIATQKQMAQFEGHTNWVHAVVFSADGQFLASASRDETIRLWDVTTKKEIAQLDGHINWVHAVVFNKYGNLLASASEDKTVRLWDVATKRQIAQLEGHTSWATSVAFSPDGKFLASGSGDKTVRLWGMDLVMTKAEKAERDQFQHGAEHRLQLEKERWYRENQDEAQKAIAEVRQSLEQLTSGGRKYTSVELQFAKGLLDQAQSAFDQDSFELAKLLTKRVKAASVEIKKLITIRRQQEYRRNGQCVVCGKKLGFFEKRSGSERCKAHR